MSELHGDPTAAVYQRLFEQNPEFEKLFLLDQTGMTRANMLAHVFEALLDMEGPRRYGLNFLQAERVSHDGGLGVTPTEYARFLTIVFETVRELLGPEWTADAENAWCKVLDEIAAN